MEIQESKLELNSKVITYDNRKIKGTHYNEAVYAEGIITKIYTLVFNTKNHLYQYRIKLPSGKNIFRYKYDIFDTEEQCLKTIDIINTRREVMREAKEKLKNL